jgi:hypothetical protein
LSSPPYYGLIIANDWRTAHAAVNRYIDGIDIDFLSEDAVTISRRYLG